MPAAKPPTAKRPRRPNGFPHGRPSLYSAEMVERICAGLMEPCSLAALCKRAGMPSRVTVCAWLIKHEDFRTVYQAAMLVRYDLQIDETTDIADDSELDPVSISKAKLRIDTRWRMAERLNARKYGPKQQIDTTVIQLSHEDWLEHLS